MRTIEDNGITWYSCDKPVIEEDKTILNFDDLRTVDKWVDEVNTWNSSNISRYIYWENPGTYMQERTNLEDMYFGYEDGKLASVAVVEGKRQLFEYMDFKEYIDVCQCLGVEGKANYMTIYNAKRALQNSTADNNSFVHFLVVNPDMQHRGIGTRAVKTILNNIEHFTGNADNNIVQSLIHYSNKASKKLFMNNDFLPVFTGSTHSHEFDNYYHVMN